MTHKLARTVAGLMMEGGTDGNGSAVLLFLRSNKGCWVSKRTKDATNVTLTHTFLDGTCTGKLSIPPLLHDGFYAAVATDISRGSVPALNELRTPVFNFFADFDLKLTSIQTEEVDAISVASASVQTVARFFPTRETVRAVVCSTPDIEDKNDDEVKTKRGVHLYFPGVHVTPHEALLMREAIVVALQRRFETVDWVNDFDNTPYVNSVGGLRMPGAPKVKKCGGCRDVPKHREECLDCFGRGHHTDRSRCYSLCTVLGRDGQVDDSMLRMLRGNTNALARAASVRCTALAVSPDWKCFDGCPSYAEMKQRSNGPPVPGSKKRIFPEESTSVRKWPKETVTDRVKIECLRNIFRTRFHKTYANVDISHVNYAPKTKTFYAQFCNEGESYCMNIEGRHRSNRVYGVVSNSVAYIRCHCNCATMEGRKFNVRCRDFCSEKKRLSNADMRVLGITPDDPKSTIFHTTSVSYLSHLEETLKLANGI